MFTQLPFKVALADSSSQTFLELFAVLISAILWATTTSSPSEYLVILGDNTAALQSALGLKGKGPLMAVARELSWRQALYNWTFSVGHLPTEANSVADALSRLDAPEPSQARRAGQRTANGVSGPGRFVEGSVARV
jgi:hypothetical protein